MLTSIAHHLNPTMKFLVTSSLIISIGSQIPAKYKDGTEEEEQGGGQLETLKEDDDDFGERNLRGLLCQAGVIIREINSESHLVVVEDGDHVVGGEEGDVEDGEQMGD